MSKCLLVTVLCVGLALAFLSVAPALSCPPKDLPDGSGYLGEESPRVESMKLPGPSRTLEYWLPPRPLSPVIPLPPPKGGRLQSSPVPQPVPYPLRYQLPRPQKRPVFRIPSPPAATPIHLPSPPSATPMPLPIPPRPYATPITLPSPRVGSLIRRPLPPSAIPINIP